MSTTSARTGLSLLLLVIAASLAPGAWSAQDPKVAAEVASVRASVAAMGKKWGAEVFTETARLYTSLHRQRDSSGIRRTSDVSYGPLAAQKLDLFVPDQGFEALGPVPIYLHDSDPASRDKIVAGTDQLLYSNVAKALARAGGVGINANYRLAAGALTPDGADDIRRLIDWTRTNVAKHGGDPQSILVLGHGEGAMRLASYLFQQSSQAESGLGIAGAILAGGSFDSPALRKLVDAYQGKAVPILLWTAEFDPVESGVIALKDRLCSKPGTCPTLADLKGHNRVSAVMSFDSPDMSAMGSLIRFYHSVVHK